MADWRCRPADFLVTSPQGILFSMIVCMLTWSWIGGETVTCQGTPRRWHCERRHDALVGKVVELGLGIDTLSGPNKRTKTEIVSRRGYHAAMIHAGDTDFRLPSRPTRDLAEADRKAWLGWAHAPGRTLELSGSTETRFLLMFGLLHLLLLAGTIASAWSWWHGPADRKRTAPSKRRTG